MDIDYLILKIRQSCLGISEISRRSQISRRAIYDILNKTSSPKVSTFNKLLSIVENEYE